MRSFGSNSPLKGCDGDSHRMRAPLNFDLNSLPPDDFWTHNLFLDSIFDFWAPEATSQEASTSARSGLRSLPHASGRQLVVPIDVEAIDDDVVIFSPRSIREGGNHSRVTIVLDDDSDVYEGRSGTIIAEESVTTGLPLDTYNIYGRNSSSCEPYINLEDSLANEGRNVPKLELQITAQKEPIFSCVICMGPLVEETSTICGHIFCKECISTAIKAQKKCPTCRQKLTMNNIHRVYLPTTC